MAGHGAGAACGCDPATGGATDTADFTPEGSDSLMPGRPEGAPSSECAVAGSLAGATAAASAGAITAVPAGALAGAPAAAALNSVSAGLLKSVPAGIPIDGAAGVTSSVPDSTPTGASACGSAAAPAEAINPAGVASAPGFPPPASFAISACSGTTAGACSPASEGSLRTRNASCSGLSCSSEDPSGWLSGTHGRSPASPCIGW